MGRGRSAKQGGAALLTANRIERSITRERLFHFGVSSFCHFVVPPPKAAVTRRPRPLPLRRALRRPRRRPRRIPHLRRDLRGRRPLRLRTLRRGRELRLSFRTL